METHWTDRRLDELNGRVDELAKRTERGFVEFRTEIQAGFERMEQRFEQIDAKLEQIDRRFDQVDRRFDQVDTRFEGVEVRLGRVEKSTLKTEAHLEDLRERTGRVEKRMDGLVYTLIGFAASISLALVGIAINL